MGRYFKIFRDFEVIDGYQGKAAIYFVGRLDSSNRVNCIKVGRCRHQGYVWSRLESLRCGCPDALVLIGHVKNADPKVEKAIHSRFAKENIRGEWFHAGGELGFMLDEMFPGWREEYP